MTKCKVCKRQKWLLPIDDRFCSTTCAKAYGDKHPLQYCKQCKCEYEVWSIKQDRGYCSPLCKQHWENLNVLPKPKKIHTDKSRAICRKAYNKLSYAATCTDPAWMKQYKFVRG